MDGVGCHANVVACHRDGLDVIVTCLAAIRIVLGAIAIATCWDAIGIWLEAIWMGLYVIVTYCDAMWVGLEAIVICWEAIGNG